MTGVGRKGMCSELKKGGSVNRKGLREGLEERGEA